MPLLPRHSPEPDYAGQRMSADEYLALGETFQRYELVNGIVVRRPSPTPLHQRLITELLLQIGLAEDNGVPIAVFPSTDVRFDAATVYCPDVLVYPADGFRVTDEPLTTAPQLVVEVVAEWSRFFDLEYKREDYERFGVSEYWALDSQDGTCRRWATQRSRLVEVSIGTGPDESGPDRLHSIAVAGLVVDLIPIREAIRIAKHD